MIECTRSGKPRQKFAGARFKIRLKWSRDHKTFDIKSGEKGNFRFSGHKKFFDFK
jgi:hypothetical protein